MWSLASPLLVVLVTAAFSSLATFLLLFARRRTIESRVLAKSRAVLKGQIGEQMAPLVDGFRYASRDARFLGHPIDYVVFDGLAHEGGDIEIVLVEVKTGRARVSGNEARIARAVAEGRVRFEVVRLST